jgi:hypothetical protein
VNAQRNDLSRGVALPPQHTGSSLFHAVLSEATAMFPDALRGADFPQHPSAWKKNYGATLARFEAHRAKAPERAEIARFIVERSQAALLHVDNGVARPLSDHMSEAREAPELTPVALGDKPSFRAEIPFEGEWYRGDAALGLIDRLAEQGDITLAARAGLRWTLERIAAQGGVLDLRDQRFALLGAGAELAPTAALLRAGASVLWVDVASPERFLGLHAPGAGTLLQAAQPLNLLDDPARIRAAIERFADSGPVHLGNFAYASGASQEWRLAAAMNAIATHVPAGLLRSISMWVSPTTVPTLQPESLRAAQAQLANEAMWKSALHRAGLLTKPGSYSADGHHIGYSTVSIQGLSYQAAQYVSKLCAAEAFALFGGDKPASSGRGITVSANVAGITRTRSLSHPVFAAAFLGAPMFSVRIFQPETTRALSVLLMLHDLLNPAAAGQASSAVPAAEKPALLHAQQMHGGIYNLPYGLESAIRIAAVLGMGKNPLILLKRPKGNAEARA